jgi:hypothetical protein
MEKLAKIVSTPTETSWSQAYNAGKLYAVLALEKIPSEEQTEEEQDLNLIGKETLEALENEFFTLEAKDLDGIKGAVERASQKIPPNIKSSLVVTAENTNILYAVIKGKGRVDLKRSGQIGPVLESNDENDLKTGSGFLQNDDVLVLQTPEFSEIISKETLMGSIESQSPSEIAETLAPSIHQSGKGGAASVVMRYEDQAPPPEVSEIPPPVEQVGEESKAKIGLKVVHDYLSQVKSLIKNRGINVPSLPHSKKVLLTIALILVLVLTGTIMLALKKQGDAKIKEAYAQVYVEAEKKYEEGQSLLDLNQALARDSFSEAKKILEGGQNKFSKGSKERKEVEELLTKVNQALSDSSGVSRVTPTEVSKSESDLLSFALEQKGGLHFTKDDKNVYTVTRTAVLSDAKELFKNSGDWEDAGGMGTFFGNIYILDKASNQILKFVATSGGQFGQSNYFQASQKPDLSTAQSMAIDGSIYVLLKDGTVFKYTKGNKDNWEVTGLDKPLSNPTRIYTDAQSNIYILDNGNSRIVELGRDGRYLSQFVAPVLKDAREMDVDESAGEIFILSGSKIYSIDL